MCGQACVAVVDVKAMGQRLIQPFPLVRNDSAAAGWRLVNNTHRAVALATTSFMQIGTNEFWTVNTVRELSWPKASH